MQEIKIFGGDIKESFAFISKNHNKRLCIYVNNSDIDIRQYVESTSILTRDEFEKLHESLKVVDKVTAEQDTFKNLKLRKDWTYIIIVFKDGRQLLGATTHHRHSSINVELMVAEKLKSMTAEINQVSTPAIRKINYTSLSEIYPDAQPVAAMVAKPSSEQHILQLAPVVSSVHAPPNPVPLWLRIPIIVIAILAGLVCFGANHEKSNNQSLQVISSPISTEPTRSLEYLPRASPEFKTDTPAPTRGKPNCSKGKPCGNSCIAINKNCNK